MSPHSTLNFVVFFQIADVSCHAPDLSSNHKFRLNPRSHKQRHTPTVVQGGGGVVNGTPPLGFCCVSIFQRDFAFVESLWCVLQDDVYTMDCGAAGGLWRLQYGSSWILTKIRNYQNTAEIENFWCCSCKIWYRLNKLLLFAYNSCFFLPKKVKNTVFTQKWRVHLLVMTHLS